MDKRLILKKIQQYYKFTKDVDFADFLGVKSNVLSNWYARGAFDYDLVITKCDEIDANWIFSNGIGEMLKKDKSDVTNFKSVLPSIVTVDTHKRENVVLVPVKAQAGYLLGYGDSKFISTLPAYRLPNLDGGTFRMFQVEGYSMYPTLPKNSYVVGRWVENWQNEIKDNRIYVIVSRDEGVIVKRVINRIEKYSNLMCKSDNRAQYPTINVDPNSIAEVWEVKLHLNFDLPDPADVYDRLSDLEAEIGQIKSLLNNKKRAN